MRSSALLSLCTSFLKFVISALSGGTILSISMSEALRTFSSSWLLTSASLSFAATSADTMIVIISPLIHAVTV